MAFLYVTLAASGVFLYTLLQEVVGSEYLYYTEHCFILLLIKLHKIYILFIHVVPVVEVIGSAHPMGLITAGNTFSITCIVNGANDLDARFNYKVIAEDNGIIHQKDASDTQFTHNFTARASDAGMYTCKVTVTSTFLNEPITISSTAVTLTVQSKAKLRIYINEKSRLCTKLLVFSYGTCNRGISY